MLSTAVICVYDVHGPPQSRRAVLDSGSQVNFNTQDCAKRLGLLLSITSFMISSVGSMKSFSKRQTQTDVTSRFNN